jgi:hypothetical protein
MSKIVADLNDSRELVLKKVKRIGYLVNYEVNTKPMQIAVGLDILDILLGQFSEQELFNILIEDSHGK